MGGKHMVHYAVAEPNEAFVRLPIGYEVCFVG